MNNPNPFLPQGAFLQQKDKARTRLKIAVYSSICLGVVALTALLIQGCRNPKDTTETPGTDTASNAPSLSTIPADTNVSAGAPTNVVDTNPPVPLPPPQPAPAPIPVPPPVAATDDYVIVKGDTFHTIAPKLKVSVKALMEANPGVDAKKLKTGAKLHVPAGAVAAPSASATPTASAAVDSAATGGTQVYKVKSGDNLTTIAKKFHVSIKSIQSANKLSTTSIKVGQPLKIPGGTTPAPAPAPAPVEPAPVSMAPPTPAPAPAPTTSAMPPVGH